MKRPMSETIYRISSWLMAISLVVNLLPLPGRTIAQTPDLPDPLDDLATSGEIYIDGMIGATAAGFELMQLLETINLTPPSELDEALVQQAREKALASAEQAARAQGAVAPLGDAVAQISEEFPTAVDALNEAQTFYSNLPAETVDELHTLGMSDTDITTLSAGVIDKAQMRVDIQQNGLPAAIETQLTEAGFTAEEIGQIEASFQQRGVFRSGLTTRMDQFRAARDELSNARTQAIIVYVQLLRYQIAARQAAGIAPRAPIDAELEELAQNEVRLLTHIAHLDDLTGGGTNPDAFEGEWWAIERYSTRAVEQIDTLIVDTQNLGLIVDLFVLMDIRAAAITAQAGDPAYAKAEADDLADLLAYLTGDGQLVASDQARYAKVPWWNNVPVLSSFFDVPVAHAAEDMALEMTQTRLEAGSSATGLALQAVGAGQIVESDEENNISSAIFSIGTGGGQLSPDLIQSILDSISGITLPQVGEFLWAVLSGQSDNIVAIGLNMGLSMIPVVGAIPDIISLIVDPNMLSKAMSVFGIVGSLGDIIALLPVPVAAQVTGATSAIVDVTATIVKGLLKISTSPFIHYLDDIPFKSAFKVGWGLIQQGITNGLRVLNGIPFPKSLDEVMPLLDEIFNGRIWGPFTQYLGFAGRHGDAITEFTEVSTLIGRLLDLKLGDDVAEAAKRIWPSVATQVGNMSDEAVSGLGKLLRNPDGAGFVNILFAEYADDVVEASLKIIGETTTEWGDEAVNGLVKIVKNPALGETVARRLTGELGDDVSQYAFQVIAKKGEAVWNTNTVDGLTAVFKKFSGDAAGEAAGILNKYKDDVVKDVLEASSDPNKLARFTNVNDGVLNLDDMCSLRSHNALEEALQAGTRFTGRNLTQAQRKVIDDTIDDLYGTSLRGNPYSHALGVESAVDELTSRGYDIKYIGSPGRDSFGTVGPDMIARDPSGNIVFIEAKGTARAPNPGKELDKSWLTTTEGVELSDPWLKNDPNRYLNPIINRINELAAVSNPSQEILDELSRLRDARQMIEQMLNGADFKRIITYAGENLGYGSGLADYFSTVEPDEVIKILMSP